MTSPSTQASTPPSLADIKAILRQRRDELRREYGVTEIGIFGSCLRGTATEGSDVDILVTFECPIGLLRFLELEGRLAQWLGAKVDLVSKTALKPRIGRRILSEVVML